MCHDCVPNTHHATTTDKSHQMIVRTSVAVPRGAMLTASYTEHLKGTYSRRSFLKETKYFDCLCNRCMDPAELGTFVSALKCAQCPNGYLLSTQPLSYEEDDAVWKCYTEECSSCLTSDKVRNLLIKIRKEVETVESSTAGSRISR
jgi:hypothetical protein